jgi:hypothetical protein
MKRTRNTVAPLVSALALALGAVPAAVHAQAAETPARAANPCSGNPCAGAKRRSRADNPCAGNPCAGKSRRRADNPCAGNPCAGKSRRRNADEQR